MPTASQHTSHSSNRVPARYGYAVTHVFFSRTLPEKNHDTLENDLSLACAVCAAAHAYTPHVRKSHEETRWRSITKMLDELQASVQSGHLDKAKIVSQLRGMQTGDILTLFVRPRNAATILTKRENCTLCESFAVSPSKVAIEKSSGSLICSYPWSATELPNEVFDDKEFQSELANFLHGAVEFHPPSPSAHPQYVTTLLASILRGVGRAADVFRITKRVRDEAHGRDKAELHGCRSSLWLLIRVAIQMSVDCSSVGRLSYKRFMLYFICTLAMHRSNANLSSSLLHLMACKILRRLSKLGSSTPDWLSKMALGTCARLGEILDARWGESSVPFPFRNPSQDELVRDTKLSLLSSGEYIWNALTHTSPSLPNTPFRPSCHHHGTLEDFLSSNGSFFVAAYRINPEVALSDVERAVEESIDDWLAGVTNVPEACTQLEILMDKYVQVAQSDNPENGSIMFLTAIELFIALDKLVVREIPMLADYSPEIPMAWLEEPFLPTRTTLHRLSCAYQYLSARHSRSYPGWSALSNEFTKDSFAVRYYDQSPRLQRLRARIERETMGNATVHVEQQIENENTSLTHTEDEPRRQRTQKVSGRSPLPTSPIFAKAVVFELQCPAYIHVWRSAIARIHHHVGISGNSINEQICRLLADVPEYRPYAVERRLPLCVQIRVYCYYPENHQSLHYSTLRYVVQYDKKRIRKSSAWCPPIHTPYFRYNLPYPCSEYVNSTSCTSNDVLTAQACCPKEFSLDEFIAFGHLRSGGSLQWLNVLHGLRNRTLNLHRKEVHFLLACAAFQVGPLDPSTGAWIWHQELQDLSFCGALLDELGRFIVDIGARDTVPMSTASLLLSRILASSPGEDISERAIVLLRGIRKKTFSWVQDMAYDLTVSPMNKERADLLWEMAATCRSTFDVDPATPHKLLHSAEDVDSLLSCALFIQALRPRHPSGIDEDYSHLLLSRGKYFSPALEVLKDAVIADPSDYGIDLAVAKLFTSYQPGAHRWKQFHLQRSNWLACETKMTMDRPSQAVHVDLLHVSLRVDGRPCGALPQEISGHQDFRRFFSNQHFFVTPSDLPGMDFMTLAITSKYKVHCSLRGDALIIRAQREQTDEVLQLIPSDVLRGDLPDSLVDGHIHWLDLSTSIIEIRPREKCWERSSENWKIGRSSGRCHGYNNHETLVDTRSPTMAIVYECLRPFAQESQELLVTTSRSMEQRLSITLPRYGLSFFVNDVGELESSDFRDMVCDENQSIGTLTGSNYLVLRPKTHLAGTLVPVALIHRRVLIPNYLPGKGSNMNPNPPEGGEPSYYTYEVDTELGCLTGSGSFASTRLLAHLHANTARYRPDPLTGRLGTQAALDLLQSGGCLSIMKLRCSCDLERTTYPQLNIAHDEIENRYYWKNRAEDRDRLLRTKRASRCTVHLFPWDATVPTSTEDRGDEEGFCPELDELEDIISAAASAVYRWSISSPTMSTISKWVELWNGTNMHADTSPPLVEDRSGTQQSSLVQKLVAKAHKIVGKKEGTRQRFSMLFLLPVVAYCSPSHQTAFLSMLLAFAMQTQSDLVNPLMDSDYRISDGYRPTEQVVQVLIRKSRINFDYESGSEQQDGEYAAKHLLKDWPCNDPPTVSWDPETWDVEGLAVGLRGLFSSCYRNWNLKEHLVGALAEPGLPSRPRGVPPAKPIPNEHASWQTSLDQLFSHRLVPELPHRATLPQDSLPRNKSSGPSNDIPVLDQLFSSLQAASAFQREYVAILERSTSVRKKYGIIYGVPARDCINALQQYYVQCRNNYEDALGLLKGNLAPGTNYEKALEQFGQWPAITAHNLLRCLASTSPIDLPGQWRKYLVSFALLLLELQHARRLLRFALDGLDEEFVKELENGQCDGWDPEEHPDWLLIQIQGNFLIRRTQAETAMEMMSPRSGQNAVMQINMGEGKSSVVIPIVAAALADGKQLARVIVPKVLTVQMFDLLVARLGGLVNRPIYHLPFSRIPEQDDNGVVISLQIDSLQKAMSRCMAERGILLVQPEHAVSLKLMGVEEQTRTGKLAADNFSNSPKSIHEYVTGNLLHASRLLPAGSFVGNIFQWWNQASNHKARRDPDLAERDCTSANLKAPNKAPNDATKWLSLQKWLHSNVRDILDESDEILHSRFQLIYTIGLEQHMDGYPDRWTIIQGVLRLVKEHADAIARNHPNSVEYECGPPGSFPHVQIVRDSDIGQRLLSVIVEDVMNGRLSNFNFKHLPTVLQDAIRCFISDVNILQVPDTAKSVEEYATCFDQNLWNGLLLLRGLIASNILLFALSERRWRVDYGLVCLVSDTQEWDSLSGEIIDPPSIGTALAVPYRAKDVPAPNTHFGHPDLTIVLTCLSYYYAGLTQEQLRVTFEILFDENDPSAEYALWIEDYGPESPLGSLRSLQEINLRSSEQWDKAVFPLFTRNQAAIDFYLARAVFPKEAKEFPWKLCGSSWDLGAKREKLITGFSGTNDGRWLLPMSITQQELDHQRGTSASVLAHLLRPENNFYMITHENGERQSTLEFLRTISTQHLEIQVLLDVGAQILDLSNRQVAKAWLCITCTAVGAVYFNEDDELMVLSRNDTIQPFSSSPFSQRLDRCVVYLDHAHTRGTDLKFPIGSRAAVTLGPKVTKDALVQGCMRMRKLGYGHSVMFFAPPGVDQSIRSLKKDPNAKVATVDILCWTIHETWTEIQQRAPHWAQQGIIHRKRYDTWSRFCRAELTPEQLSDAWLQPDAKPLADLYTPCKLEAEDADIDLSGLPGLQQRCKDLGVLSLSRGQLDEEQEREVHREREREREVELPPKAQPAKHFLHPDVVSFVQTGIIPPLHFGTSSAFLPVFATLGKTSAATREADVWSTSILATEDFCRTINPESTKGTMDQYLRPVQWVLSRQITHSHVLVLLSPFEVDRLISDIRVSKHVHLHLYAPRTSQRMKPSNDLGLYSIPPIPSDWTPPWDLIDQLNMFAGQLYLKDYKSYLRLCLFLGVPTNESPNDTRIRRNLFNIPGSFEETEITFASSPLPSVMALLAIRNRGRPFDQTHMGKILQGQLLTRKEFERLSPDPPENT